MKRKRECQTDKIKTFRDEDKMGDWKPLNLAVRQVQVFVKTCGGYVDWFR